MLVVAASELVSEMVDVGMASALLVMLATALVDEEEDADTSAVLALLPSAELW